ncbi:ras-domain-containing protein [Guyanagaster necrorhizus]|uniref:Ras-domain-containing protein n=1 Tax=Guyanagaster necrorhizus TaxID=856835 RepID=A0A9P8AN74_9AGAR|nr:ras-domain-containing protein [Guyanagaster necrorhizus MCA 3950]KAG7440602.1 ras-domain-containing protein [Guyanagaster necrorhizus MCA 3950]
MLTVKLVVIGASGVGKTSLRTQYISGRFSNSYRATIGTDFITKTVPHPTKNGEYVTLQIWDTAGQERFSSLSTAFFRGADAVLLMFDVNASQTMDALKKWWQEFREGAPLAEEDAEDFCCVVVGNKMDLANGEPAVTRDEAQCFIEKLIPSTSRPETPINLDVVEDDAEADGGVELSSSQVTERPMYYHPPSSPRSIHSHQRSSPSHSPNGRITKSRSLSSSRFYGGTMTTTHTTLTVYHTPSSSLFDVYQSARSSPEPPSNQSSPQASVQRPRRLTNLSTGSESSTSVVTMTPSLFALEQSSSTTMNTTPEPSVASVPDRGPKLFYTSAKTGDGVSDVFEYIARRVVSRWEYDERIEARRLRIRDASAADTIRLGLERGTDRSGHSRWGDCCGS